MYLTLKVYYNITLIYGISGSLTTLSHHFVLIKYIKCTYWVNIIYSIFKLEL